jgi:hypothetical protein
MLSTAKEAQSDLSKKAALVDRDAIRLDDGLDDVMMMCLHH